MNDEQESTASTLPGLFQYESSTERVTDQKRIAAIMMGLKTERSILAVTVPQFGGHFLSAILKVDQGKSAIWLDELTPHDGHDAVLKAAQVHVNASLRGVGIHFKSILEEAGEQNGVAWYRCAFPQLVHYMQRRSWYRVTVGSSHVVPLHIELADQATAENEAGATIADSMSHPLRGRLHDISLGGIGMWLPRDTELEEGRLLEQCVVDIPGDAPLVCRLEIRHVRLEPVAQMVRAGGRFLEIGSQQRRVIEHFQMVLERENLRRYADNIRYPRGVA